MVVAHRPVYATQPHQLRKQIEDVLARTKKEQIDGELKALIVPDTNLLSGAPVAASVYKILEGRSFDTIIIITPSHTGSFERLNICRIDNYRTPFGDVPVNDFVRNELCDEDDDIFLDDTGHYHTEGVDVQIPYLQLQLDRFDVVPVVMGQERPELCHELGNAVGEIMYGRKTLVIACADLLSADEQSMEKFERALTDLNVSEMMHLLNSEEVVMEGRGPILVAMIAAIRRRGNRAKIIKTRLPEEDEPGYIGGVIWRE